MIDLDENQEFFDKQTQLLRKWSAGIKAPVGFDSRLRVRLENMSQSFWSEVMQILPKLAPVAAGLLVIFLTLLAWVETENTTHGTAKLPDTRDEWLWIENTDQLSDEMILVQTWELVASTERR
ncbi:hypothetical protein JXJ21_20510 [candidate division KSB1 bacterium]|nr:hypothetical protein [candidate division KSB1 bacterium]